MSNDDHETVVRRSFEQQVELFTGEDSPFARRPASPIPWVGPLDQDMIVLDVACGAAHAAEEIAPHVRQVVGVDLTPALLHVGAERLRQTGVANVLLQTGTAADLPFLDASFDLVICRSALHHFPDPDQAVAEMARTCRPGGRVVAVDMVAPTAEVREMFDELQRRLDPSHVGVLLEAELAELLRSTVGPLTYQETPDPITLPIDFVFTEATDREPILSALHTELAGGATTGFQPVSDGDQLLVSFETVIVHATKESG
jgi:SAM-dependent methyltransferase